MIFQGTVSTVKFSDNSSLVIFTEGGLELKIDCSFQYAVIKEEVSALYKNYGTTYPQQIVSISRSILKNIAPTFTTSDYYQKRDKIAQTMYQSLKTGLRRDMNVNVSLFQLDYVRLPDILLKKLLSIALQEQTNIQEQYLQQSAVIRQQTISLAEAIIANASVINQTAISKASFLINQANALAFTTVQEAKKNGLELLYSALVMNNTNLKLSFLYTTQLNSETGSNVDLLVNLNTAIVHV